MVVQPPKPTYTPRGTERVAVRSSGEMRINGVVHRIQLLDVSSGGCKFRLADDDGAAFPYTLPLEFEMSMGVTHVDGAVIWLVSGMFGCRFFEHISLDDVVSILAGGFRIRLQPPSGDAVTE